MSARSRRDNIAIFLPFYCDYFAYFLLFISVCLLPFVVYEIGIVVKLDINFRRSTYSLSFTIESFADNWRATVPSA